VVNWYLKIIRKTLNLPQLRYFVYDGAFGNKAGIQATRRADLHLISKLKKNSSLYFKFTGEQKGRGRKRKYGELIDYQNMDKENLKKTTVNKDIETKIYQFQALHKTINEPINVILIFSTNLKTKKTTHTILFSTDLEQGYEKIIDYYSLRFQIEFNFRDAKQYFGLEDFMNIKKRRLHNFANLSLFMNNLSYLLYKDSYLSRYSINDIKSLFMAERYTRETLKFYGQKVDDILISKAITHIAQFSMIYRDSA
jgi:putative transposase